jgi:hypothetical protein
VKVNAVFFRVINPTKAVVEVNDFLCATSQGPDLGDGANHLPRQLHLDLKHG